MHCHNGTFGARRLHGAQGRRAGHGYPSGRVGVWYTGERATPKGFRMIKLTRINNAPIVINSDLIEYIEAIPDTMITLTTGQKIMVREGVDDVIERVKDYRRSLMVKPFLE